MAAPPATYRQPMAVSITITCSTTMSLRSAGASPTGGVVLDQADGEQHEHHRQHVQADGAHLGERLQHVPHEGDGPRRP